jgi:hypothetical protein
MKSLLKLGGNEIGRGYINMESKVCEEIYSGEKRE